MNKIGFIIINFNDHKTTKKLINNIKNYKIIDEIVVVDNKSTDKSVLELKKIDNITLIANKENYGFAKAINIGCKYLINKYKDCYIFVSNSDIRIEEENDLKELVKTFKVKDIALVGPVIKEPDGVVRGWKLTSVNEDILMNIPLINRVYRNKLLNYKDSYYTTLLSYVDMVKGCFFLIDSKALEKINYLDENTFLYYEENILARKLKGKKLLSVVDTSVFVEHKHNATIGTNVSRLNKYKIYKASQFYYEKNYNNANKLTMSILKFFYNISLFIKETSIKLKEKSK